MSVCMERLAVFLALFIGYLLSFRSFPSFTSLLLSFFISYSSSASWFLSPRSSSSFFLLSCWFLLHLLVFFLLRYFYSALYYPALFSLRLKFHLFLSHLYLSVFLFPTSSSTFSSFFYSFFCLLGLLFFLDLLLLFLVPCSFFLSSSDKMGVVDMGTASRFL